MVHATVSAPVGWCKPSTVPYIRMKSSWRMTHGGFCLAGGRGQCHPCSIAIKHLLIAGSMHKMPQIASTSQSTPSLSLDPLQNAGVPVCILATYIRTQIHRQAHGMLPTFFHSLCSYTHMTVVTSIVTRVKQRCIQIV